jgi:ABC-type amino acid transport substrate-binding protein
MPNLIPSFLINIITERDFMIRWQLLFLAILVSSCAPKHEYTEVEKNYIATHVVEWCARPTSYPYEFLTDDGTFKGLSVDYLELISQKSGIKIRIAAEATMSECQVLLKAGMIQMVSAVRPTPERSEYSTFTRPYVYVETVMLKHTNNPKTVGIGRAYAVKMYLENDRKDLVISEYDDDEQAVKAMLAGGVDSVVMDTESAKMLRKKYRLEVDQVTVPFEYPLSFAFRPGDTVLRGIFDKAISDITDEEHARIRRKWM